MFAPLPETVPLKTTGPVEAQVVLGRMLFYDTRLSKSQTIACNSCHDLSNYGVDGEPTSEGSRGQRGETAIHRRSTTPQRISCSSGTAAHPMWRPRRRDRC
jgi:cytochrome c peroxidase